MLKITDRGCNQHDRSQVIMFGPEAELIKDIIYNLPRKGEFHTFICEHGHTHHISFKITAEKGVSNYGYGRNNEMLLTSVPL